VPTKAQVISGGFPLTCAGPNASWAKSQLGHYADRSGVYILHAAGAILYVGKTTTGDFGTFGERLRRHCQFSASQNSRVHQLLVAQETPVYAYLLDLEDISMMIDAASMSLSPERKALVMEQILIGIYQPPWNIDLPNTLRA
jgi:excinuclease UvrABC nuclease subunit